MKVFQNKSIFKKLIFVLICVIIVSFCIPKEVSAEDENGGVLIKPIVSLFLSLGDGLMGLAHSFVLNQSEVFIVLDGDSNVWAWIAGIVVTVVVVAAVIFTAGAAIPTLLAAAPGTVLLISVVIGGASGYAAAAYVDANWLEDDLKLPIFTLTPQEIFSNKIPLFDVDFFNPSDSMYVDNRNTYTVPGEEVYQALHKYIIEQLKKDYDYKDSINEMNLTEAETPDQKEGVKAKKWNYNKKIYMFYYIPNTDGDDINEWKIIRYNEGGSDVEYLYYDIPGSDGYGASLTWKDGDSGWTDTNIDIKVKNEDTTMTEESVKEIKSTARELQSSISNWYIILRDIALVSLLSILVYVGIRIIISSTSSDKAKYKQMLLDWIVAICLLFVMQYIMSGSNLLVQKITDLLSSAGYPQYLVVLDEEQTEEAVKQINNASDEARSVLAELGILDKDKKAETLITTEDDGTKYLNWNTNLFGILRIEAQLSKSGRMTYAGYMIMYVMLCLFTIYFIFTYLKRVLYMAFLTIIAPLVALTYPIDKMNDGKAQAFDMWFKEYIFNLLIQPLHLLLYTVLVSSAIELASENVLYSIVAIAFLIPAEKLMRKFFGFEKAQTPGLLAGPAGAAMAMSGLNRLMGHRPPKHSENGKSGKNVDTSESKKISFNNNYDKEDGMIGSMIGDGKNKVTQKDKSELVNPMMQSNSVDKSGKAQNNKKLLTPNAATSNIPTKPMATKTIKKPSVRKGLQTAGRSYKNAMKRKMKNYVSNAHPIRTATRFAAGATGAAVFGTAAGIAGLTSGDPSKAFQYASAGVMGGYKLGDSVAGMTQSMLDVPVDLDDTYRKGYYGSEEEYNKAAQEKYVREMKKNEEIMQKLEDKFGKEEAEYIRDNVIDDYAEAEIFDIDDIMAGYEAEKEEHLDREQIKSGIKYSKRIGQDTSKMKKDDLNKWEKTFSDEFSENERVKNENLDSEELGKKTLNTVKLFNKYRYK